MAPYCKSVQCACNRVDRFVCMCVCVRHCRASLFLCSIYGCSCLRCMPSYSDTPTHPVCYNNHSCYFLIFFFFFWVGELFITHTCTCNERNHKRQTEGHPQPKLQTTLTTWVEVDTKVCKEATCQAKQAAYKVVVHQPTAKPVHFQQTKYHLCLNQPNIAVKITSILKCQAKQAADKTAVHHQYAKLAPFHKTKGKFMPSSIQHYK